MLKTYFPYIYFYGYVIYLIHDKCSKIQNKTIKSLSLKNKTN